MATLKTNSSPRDPKPDHDRAPLARVMREFEDLVLGFETGLLRSLEDCHANMYNSQDKDRTWCRQDVRDEACRLAISELSSKYTRKHIRRSLNQAESHGKRVEEQLNHTPTAAAATITTTASLNSSTQVPGPDDLASIHSGYFRLYSTELFDMLGQPTDLRFGTLRFHAHGSVPAFGPEHGWVSLEMALSSSFFVADSIETLPFHVFRLPHAPSLQNRGILSRKPEDDGAFPDYDSWLLFTFLGNGCLKVEVPIEMCADVYGGPLVGRDNEEVVFWGVFVDDDA
ncbi:hypothetical protein BS50DRAFT_55666 [Corynespora cassiicola Philippines]|uniref:Uncharacterized protein n=1 Tax=Corynespora cassiicola Philippines TaxID=1448308 RepID=A0A2T2NJW0_CORCC|nr:hypothetical protein BS50DRAFT_55666 [Corynespora cassiicola Philippines]